MITTSLTASALHRVFACPASAHLPHEAVDTPLSDAGREKHAMIAANIEQGILPVGLPQRLVPIDARPEVAMRYDALAGTARELVGVTERGYPPRAHAHEYDGTADIVGTQGDTVVVGDWKSRGEQIPVKENPQLIFLATMAALITNRRRAHVWIARTTEDGEPFGYIDEAFIEAEQMVEFGHRLRALHVDLAAPHFATGKHCRYCPAIGACPEVRAQIERATRELSQAATAPAAQLWRLREAIKPMLRRFDEIIHAKLADGGSIPLDDKTELRMVQGEGRRVLNASVCLPIARTELGSYIDAQLRPELSQEQIKDAAREAGVPIAPTLARIIAACEAAGGIGQTAGSKSVKAVPRAELKAPPIVAPPAPRKGPKSTTKKLPAKTTEEK